jgi:hypothetical protein
MDDCTSRETAIKILQDPTTDHKERAINRLPAADVKPVVRCKECKYYEEHHYEREGEPPYIKGKCGNKFGLNRQYMVHPEEFCSRGERRE